MVRSMWLFKHKVHAEGTLSRYKARLVANGSSQQLGVDFDETFSPVIKSATIHTVLSLAVSRYATRAGFYHSRSSSPVLLQQIIDSLHNEFDMTDLGALNYFLGIYATRTPTVQHICLYMHDPREPHFATLKRILRYVQRTVDFGLQLYVFVTTSLVGYTDADWTAWLRNLLRELHYPLSTTTLVYCNNVSAIYMSANPVQHQLTKHIKIDIHSVRDMVTVGQVRVLHVPSRYQYADIFTKGLPSALLKIFNPV
ncbi:ribonuclease H-like domain-containing protein [Tanacetum coccineum]